MLLACGSNGNFQLGNGTDDDINCPKACTFLINGEITTSIPSPVKRIACGGNHTLVLLESGDVFSAGDNTYGQCGHTQETTKVRVFTQVPGTWKDVLCGWEFSVLLSVTDQVYVCGLGLKGELGLGKTTQSTLTLLPSASSRNITRIESSVGLTVCQTSDGFVAWGDLKKGQLGRKEILYEPESISLVIEPVRDFKLTKTDLVLQLDHRLVLFGRMAIDVPEPTTDLRVMWSSIHYRDSTGKIISLGNDRHGQSFPHFSPVPNAPFTTGSEHGIIVLDKVYAWGWGEHGNCGYSSIPEHDQIVFRQLNPIYTDLNHPPQYIGGGCATTWITI